MPETWYSASQALICLFAGATLFSIYARGAPARDGGRGSRRGREPGLFWLASAVALWGLLGAWLWAGVVPFGAGEETIRYIRIFSSIPNSAFLLLAAASMDYGPDRLKFLQADRRWRQVVLVVAVLASAVTVLLPRNLISGPDVCFSLFTLMVVGYGLERSFRLRGFRLLAALAGLAILMQMFAQVLELLPKRWLAGFQEPRWILLLSSKTMFTMASLALAMTWAWENWELTPVAKEMVVRFTGNREGKSWLLEMSLPGRLGPRRIKMTEAPHFRFLKFAVRRIRHGDGDAGWINLHQESLDHKDLKRICEAMDLKIRALFENDGAGSYRLAISPGNLHLERELLGKDPQIQVLLRELDGA